MAKPPYFAFYPKDFAADELVEAMTTLEVGAYILLLCKAWQSEPPASLPNDDSVLARYARVDPAVWTAVRTRVLAPFTLGTDNRWYQPRLRREFAAAQTQLKTFSVRGQKAAQARWAHAGDATGMQQASHLHATGMQDGMLEQCLSNASHSEKEKRESPPHTPPKEKKEKQPPPPPQGGVPGLFPDAQETAPPSAPPGIPPALDTPAFRAVWASWVQHRKEIRHTLKDTTAAAQLKRLASWGPERAIAALEYSILQGYQGIVEPDARAAPSRNGPPPPPAESDAERDERVRRSREEDARDRESACSPELLREILGRHPPEAEA